MVRLPGVSLVERTMEGVQGRFTSPTHSTRVAAILGTALGISFTLCFATGLITWLIQHPTSWFVWPARPAGLYRLLQGLHVAAGIASIPLLLAKLWAVYPHFWTWPAVRNVAHAIERLSLLPLVGGSLFLLFSGTANVARWYPWTFAFPYAHYWAAWITMGGLVAHIGSKIHIARDALKLEPEKSGNEDGLDRRHFIGVAAGASGLLTVVTIGQTFRPLSSIGLLAPRDPNVGPQGIPVNKTASGANVVDLIADVSAYRLVVRGDVDTELELSLDDLRAMEQRRVTLPIACVEGWSANAKWTGVPVRALLDLAGVRVERGTTVDVESLQPRGAYRSSSLRRPHLVDRDTLLALRINGEVLHPDHGYPLRLIAPNRPGVLQTKWVDALVVHA